jgi:hypothetical protein
MSLHITNTPPGASDFNMTGPAGSWFAVAIAQNSTDMMGATAFIFTIDNTTGQQVLRVQTLGNHQLGPVQAPSYPCTITMLGTSIVQVVWRLGDSESAIWPAWRRALSTARYWQEGTPPAQRPDQRIQQQGYTCFLFAQGSGGMTVSMDKVDCRVL